MLLSTLNKDPKEPFDVIYKAPDLWRTDSFWRPESKVNALWEFHSQKSEFTIWLFDIAKENPS